jgi:predicted amidohydrolase YtcJ
MSGHAFSGGRILTMDPASPEPAVLRIADGRIEAAGGRELLDAPGEVLVHDLGGRTLVPGFIDAHNHLSHAALHPRWADLSAARSLEDVARALRAQAEAEPDAAWIRGVGWGETPGEIPLSRRDLDALGLDRPVIVAHYTYHQCVVDSRGLDLLGIGVHTPDPEGGEITRGERGEPTGLLVERAWSAAHAASVRAYADPERWPGWIEARARELLRHGVTCVHDAACSLEAEAAYRRLASAGRLPIGVVAMLHPMDWFTPLAAQRLEGPPTGEGDERFRVGPVKLFADGGAQPAIELCLGGQRLQTGHLFPGLAEQVERVMARGFRVAVHAMGNRGVDATLEALERAARNRGGEPRFRLEHATLVRREQMPRLRALAVIGVVQPGFVEVVGRYRDQGTIPEVEGLDWMPFRELAEAGIPLAASSDDPCAPLPPLWTVRFGIRRNTPGGLPLGPSQALPWEDWLRAYSVGAAFAGGQEGERGSLSPGKRADLVVIDGDPGSEAGACVSETWVGGERVYAAEPGGAIGGTETR